MSKIRTVLILSAVVASAFTAEATAALPHTRAALKASPQKFAGFSRMAAPASRSEGALVADFTVKGAESLAEVYADSFDAGLGTWSAAPASSDITWTTKALAGDKSYGKLKPGDAASLYVEGPYQAYKRAISTLTSEEIDVPDKGTLTMHVGYSLNYNDVASLVLSISDDGFATSTELWNSTTQPGERPWAWRAVSADVSAFAGKKAQLRFTYGPGTADNFGTGGYLADFAVDGLAISGMKPVESIAVATGEEIGLVDISAGNPVEWQWSMPGAVPAESDEATPTIYYTADGTYDISLTVTDADGNKASTTRTAFVTVTGTAPVAKIIPPATFRSTANGKPLIAPMVPVRFTDGSTGFPTEHSWLFTLADIDPDVMVTSSEQNPEVAFYYLHDHLAGLSVSNSHGSSDATCEVTAEYSAVVSNLEADERATTFDMDDWGIFPGSNTRKITAYAEKFSAPSRPVMIDGAYVFFNRAEAEEVTDQIANVGVHIYTSKDGKPDKRLDSMWWSVFELDLPTTSGQLVGTAFPFTESPIVDGEFFIVVDGIPEYSETCAVSFGMAQFRAEGNTAYMLKEGEWMPVSDYFPAGANHTSFMIYPSVHHSVMSSLAEGNAVEVGAEAGKVDYPIFSYLGYEMPPAASADWLRATGEPNGMTVDDIHIEYDALPAGEERREATLTLTDGASKLDILVKQSRSSAAATIEPAVGELTVFPAVFADSFAVFGLEEGEGVTVYNTAGAVVWHGNAAGSSLKVDASAFVPGVYVVASESSSVKAVKK